jgi:NitT/TauT family transport system substrate-binding protein
MAILRRLALAGVAAVLLFAAGAAALAGDVLRFASTGIGWDNSVAPFGQRAGIFKDAGIDLQISTTDGSGPALQALIAGAVDVAVVSVPAFIGAVVKGAPLKMITSNFRGGSDMLWYVRTDSPIRSLKDVTATTTLGYSVPGAANFILLSALLEQYKVRGNLIATGNQPATLTQVMTGQVDIGHDGNGGLGVSAFEKGEVRPIAYGSELEMMRKVTVRGLVVSETTLATRRDALIRFVQAYQKTVDWMYQDARAMDWYAEANHAPLEAASKVVKEMYPREAMILGSVDGVDVSLAQGLAFKRIEHAPREDQLEKMFDIVWTPGTQ